VPEIFARSLDQVLVLNSLNGVPASIVRNREWRL